MGIEKMGTPSSARIIKYVDLVLKALEIFDRSNWDAVESVADRNGHRWKLVDGGKCVSWGGVRTKYKGSECKLAKNMFFYSDMLKLCVKKKHNITDFFPDRTFLTIRNLVLRTDEIKYRELFTNQIE